MYRLLLISLLLFAGAASQAQIYKSVDREGNVTFSDRPPAEGEQAEAVELGPMNTSPAPEALPAAPRSREDDQQQEPAPEPRVSITSPEEDQVIPIGELGSVTISARAEPPLSGGEQLQLLLNGEPQGDPQQGSQWLLENLRRGGHDISVTRLDADDQVTASSDPVRFYMMRPLNIRNQRSTPAPN